MSKIKLPKAKPEGLQYIELVLKMKGLKYETEYLFLKGRRYRFDVALPDKKIAIEYEGLPLQANRKSRHTTIKGYSNDCEKYNNAVCNGWRLLRFTALNYKMLGEFLSQLLPESD